MFLTKVSALPLPFAAANVMKRSKLIKITEMFTAISKGTINPPL
jgi:hypothetical protein